MTRRRREGAAFTAYVVVLALGFAALFSVDSFTFAMLLFLWAASTAAFEAALIVIKRTTQESIVRPSRTTAMLDLRRSVAFYSLLLVCASGVLAFAIRGGRDDLAWGSVAAEVVCLYSLLRCMLGLRKLKGETVYE